MPCSHGSTARTSNASRPDQPPRRHHARQSPPPRHRRSHRRRQDIAGHAARGAPAGADAARTTGGESLPRTLLSRQRALRVRDAAASSCSSAIHQLREVSRARSRSTELFVADFLLEKDALFASLTLADDELDAVSADLFEPRGAGADSPTSWCISRRRPPSLIDPHRRCVAGRWRSSISEAYLSNSCATRTRASSISTKPRRC